MRRISACHLLLLIVCLPWLGTVGCGGPKRLPPVISQPPAPDGRPGFLPSLLGVGLAEKADQLLIYLSGPVLLLDPDTGERLGRLESEQSPIRLTRSGTGITWSAEEVSGAGLKITLQPIDPDHLISWDEKSYRGEFMVMPTPGAAGLTLVNNLDLEAYLRGVVPWEIGRHGADRLDALKAQAVAARTYTVSHLGTRRERGFDLFASVMDQVYKGAADEDPLCNQAILATEGVVLKFGDRYVDAYYSACCGGLSSQIEEVWPRPSHEYLVCHGDGSGPRSRPYCYSSKYYSWNESWTWSRLEQILSVTLPEYHAHFAVSSRARWAGSTFSPSSGSGDMNQPGRLLSLEITARTRSGRVANLDIVTEAGTHHVKGDRSRWVLKPASGNPAILRSAMFDLVLGDDPAARPEIRATGRGFGHGIGMCQTGALARAEAGQGYQEILQHYYPGTQLVRVTSAGGV